MKTPSNPPLHPTVGVLISGGLDSSILVGHLLRERRGVQPFYIRTGLVWQQRELQAVQRFLAAVATDQLAPLVVLDLPLADLYAAHWSVTGCDTPDAQTPDEAVFLPGRNALLLIKAAIWCQLHGIRQLALAPLGSSPFEDAGPAFFRDFQSAINRGAPAVEILRPFGQMHKSDVMQLGRGMPLELTFSCIAPKIGKGTAPIHCGECNKCAERQTAFASAGLLDRTPYANACPVG